MNILLLGPVLHRAKGRLTGQSWDRTGQDRSLDHYRDLRPGRDHARRVEDERDPAPARGRVQGRAAPSIGGQGHVRGRKTIVEGLGVLKSLYIT